MQEELTEIFRTVFEDPALEINRATTAADVEGWDSITHLTLITTVEENFGVSFTGFEIMKMQNVGDMIDLIEQKRKG
jgi:acyl carrier protein